MSYRNLTVKRSGIEGYGLYANEHIKQGEIIMFWMAEAYLIPEDEYNKRQRQNDQQIIATGARYVGPMFLYTDIGLNKDRYENYINHSYKPNVLYHCGVCFALKDIYPDDELTVDYTYLLSSDDQESFVDADTKTLVRGTDWRTCLLHTAKQLTNLLSNVSGCASDSDKVAESAKKINLYVSEKYAIEQAGCSPKSISESSDSYGSDLGHSPNLEHSPDLGQPQAKIIDS